MNTNVLIALMALLLAGFSAPLFVYALKAAIARANMSRALLYINVKHWEMLEKKITLGSYKWQFGGRKYILVVGLITRQRLERWNLELWSRIVDSDSATRRDILRMQGCTDQDLAEYLSTQVRNDAGLLTMQGALISFLGSAICLTIAIIMLIYALAKASLR